MNELKVTAKKIGGIWHGYVESHPEIDERALTDEIALRKARELAQQIAEQQQSS